jgi:hypothetical protein
VSVLHAVLRTLARTHPDPARLLATWREALAETMASGPPGSTEARDSASVAERYRSLAEDWTAELVELAVPGSAASRTAGLPGDDRLHADGEPGRGGASSGRAGKW